MSNLKLSYWIRGTSLEDCSTITMQQEDTIQDLKELIVRGNKSFVEPVMATEIDIYKVPKDKRVVNDDSMKEELGKLTISQLGRPLRSTHKLRAVIETPEPKGEVQLIVDVLLLQCLYRNEGKSVSFMFRTSVHQRVGLLKSDIKTQDRNLARIPDMSLAIYKLCASGNSLQEELGHMESGTWLKPEGEVGDAFKDVPFSDLPTMMLELTNEKPTKQLSARGEDPITRARDEFLSVYQKKSPSSGGIPSTFRSRQRGDTFIPCGRACDNDRSDEEMIPTTLLHPIFGQFADDCHEFELREEDHLLAADLEIAMSTLYKDEASRVDGVSEVLQKHRIDLRFSSKIPNSRYVIDGDMSVGRYRYVIAEFKNEVGGTPAEPFLEAIAYYVESTREFAPKNPRSPLPCLLLAIYGPHIVFAGATWNRRPVVQVLSMPVAFHIHHTDYRNQLTVARHMAAFRRASQGLKTYYEQIGIGEIPIPPSTFPPPAKELFPYPTTYTTLSGDDVKTFRYTQVVEKKLVFFATQEDDGSCICVKFTRTYSVEAHQYLASRNCAPAMRGIKNLPGDWIMIVVDALLEFETVYDRKEPLPSTLLTKMQDTLEDFHKHGFVHGDIRDVNIMVRKKSNDGEFRFIDLDWSGLSGLARYPARINTSTIKRPLNVISGGIIKPSDDLFMLDEIRTLKCRD